MKKYSEPWAIGYQDRGLGHGDFGVVDSKGNLVVGCCNSQEEAENIVMAHNNHYPLIEALQETLKCLENWMEIAEDHDKRDYDYEAVKKAQQAIDNAKNITTTMTEADQIKESLEGRR